jgi:hypothetical protein
MSKHILINYGQPIILLIGLFYYIKGYKNNTVLNTENKKLKMTNKNLETKISEIKSIQENIHTNYLRIQQLLNE